MSYATASSLFSTVISQISHSYTSSVPNQVCSASPHSWLQWVINLPFIPLRRRKLPSPQPKKSSHLTEADHCGVQAISQGPKDWLSSSKLPTSLSQHILEIPWYRERHKSHKRIEMSFSQPQISCHTGQEKHLLIPKNTQPPPSTHRAALKL